jgi:tRNA-dihydrouridine synthase
MRYYFAPMEGITDSIYRRTHHKYFPGLDRYYMPFLSPTMHRTLTHKESRELPMADSESFVAIPQILTKIPGDFLWAAQVCQERGYEEVNLNVGCPSGTVVAKGKGAGMLRSVSDLDAFLDAVFSKSPIAISVKTRLGMEQAEEFPALLEVFNRYPIKELTIHPRVRKQFYSGGVDREMFRYAVDNSRKPLCYNGNLNSTEDIAAFSSQYPQLEAVMLGRGLIADPGMLTPGGTTKESLKAFADELLEQYVETFGGARNAMFRMKENWSFLRHRFQDSERLWKQLRKTTDIQEYRAITEEVFATLPLAEELLADW